MPSFVFARALYYGLCRELTTNSLADISSTLGQNHATAVHSVTNIYKNFSVWNMTEYLNAANRIKDEFLDYNYKSKKVEDLIKENVKLRKQIQDIKDGKEVRW